MLCGSNPGLLQSLAWISRSSPGSLEMPDAHTCLDGAGSYILLDEKIQDITEAAGCVVIVLAVTMYLVVQAAVNRHPSESK